MSLCITYDNTAPDNEPMHNSRVCARLLESLEDCPTTWEGLENIQKRLQVKMSVRTCNGARCLRLVYAYAGSQTIALNYWTPAGWTLGLPGLFILQSIGVYLKGR